MVWHLNLKEQQIGCKSSKRCSCTLIKDNIIQSWSVGTLFLEQLKKIASFSMNFLGTFNFAVTNFQQRKIFLQKRVFEKMFLR